MIKVIQHPTLGEVTLSQRWTTSRISLVVKPSGEIRLSYPRLVSTAKALRFLEDKREWIERARKRVTKNAMVGAKYSKGQIEAMRKQAKAILPAMVERLARQHGFSYGRVTIRAARSKWGSCSSERNLSLSLFLMTLPHHLQEFVVLHELCHTVHFNHSAEFHTLLSRVTNGREKELKRQLKSVRKNLRFRKGQLCDLDRIMELVSDAQSWFRKQNIDQWQDGYPTRELILSDIECGHNYVVEYNGDIVATAVISFSGEPTYAKISGKGWLNDDVYGVVHRIAVSDTCRRKGIACEILHYAEELAAEQGVKNIRIDTHRDNHAMRVLIKKMGYSHCGVITLSSGALREAYQKELTH